MVGPEPRAVLSLTGSTCGHPPLDRFVEAAAAAGFGAISIWPKQFHRARSTGASDADIRRLLADHGLALDTLDCLNLVVGWDDLATRPTYGSPDEHDDVLAIAAELAPRAITAIFPVQPRWDHDEAVALLARTADHVRDRVGADLLLEPVPSLPGGNLATAVALVGQAARPNLGLLIDSWHLFRSGASTENLAGVPADLVRGVQLADAPLAPEPDLLRETLHRRLLPGAGELDLRGFVAAVRTLGYDGPWCVEVFSDELATQPCEEVARAAADAARRILDP